jgi:8-oxo-dGTP diphosphatase
MNMINVTCAVIRNEDNEVLIVQRGEMSDHHYKWEFPGGKLSPGESEEECIIREVEEELSMEIIICGRLPVVEHDYGHKKIRLIPFICDSLDELPLLSEHVAFKWISPEKLITVDFTAADVSVAASYVEGIRSESDPPGVATALHEISGEIIDDAELQSMVERMISMKEAGWVATSAAENPAVFHKLLDYSFSADSKLAFHASWVLSKACDMNPELIYPHLKDIIDKLEGIENESAMRSVLRIISFSDLDRIGERYHGILADHCFNLLRSGTSAIAIKAHSMEILYKLAIRYPELGNELSATIIMLQAEGSAAIIARGRQILKKLSRG